MQLLHSLLFMIGAMAPYILLGFFIAGLMHAFIPQQTLAHHLSGTGPKPVVKAALFGIPLPLCSCGVLPTAIAMRRGGASRASSTSFLLATPQTGVDSIAATWSLLGPAFAIVRPIAALVTAVFGGVAVGCGEKNGEATAAALLHDYDDTHAHQPFGRKVVAALRYGFIDLVSSIGGWLVVGLVIAAVITVYVPADTFASLGRSPLLSMIAVLIIAVPMYVCATGSIPIAMSLILKGLSPGTALVLLMAGPAVNFASYALVAREMGRRAAITYLASIVVGAMAFGLMIDYLLPHSWFALPVADIHSHAHQSLGVVATISSVILVALLIIAFVRQFLSNHKSISDNMTQQYNIQGMNCPHCQAAVAKSIRETEGVEKVDVILNQGLAIVEGNPEPQKVIEAVRAAGFDASVR